MNVKILAIVIVIILVSVGVWAIFVKDDAYVPELNVTLYSRSSVDEVYRAEMDMEVNTQEFIDYFYPATIGTDFPKGDYLLEVLIYELPDVNADKYHKDTRVILDREWWIGDLYGGQKAGSQEWMFTIDLPELTTDKLREHGAVYLLAIVRYGNQDIGIGRWTVNPDGAVE